MEAAQAMAKGVRTVLPKAKIRLLPIADGGDGLMEVLLRVHGGRKRYVRVTGPFGEKIKAHYGELKGRRAVVEMARASGMALTNRRDPLNATSYGTGELIAAALRRGARTVLVGMGGAASNDGGAGMAQALGAKLLDSRERELGLGALPLLKLDRIIPGRLPKGVSIKALSDVVNPLLGPQGSARIFGPQKGATPRMVAVLERALTRYAAIVRRDLGLPVARLARAGAAGGLGAGLAAFLAAKLVPGADWVLDELGADQALQEADLVLTGEGKMDATSLYGKAPVTLARRAKSRGVPVAAVCAVLENSAQARFKKEGFKEIVAFTRAGAKGNDSVTKAAHWAARGAALAVKSLGLAALLWALPARAAAQLPFAELDKIYYERHLEGRLEESLSRIEKLLIENPEHPALLWRQGRSLTRLGERQKSKKEKLKVFLLAEEKLKRSVAIKDDDPESHFWLGVTLGRRGETQGILKSLFLVGPLRREMETVLKLDPQHGGAYHVLGEMDRQIPGFAGGDKKRAVAQLEKSVELEPSRTSHHIALAEAYLAVKKKDKAIEILKKVAEVKNPADPAEYQDDFKDAEKMLAELAD